MLTLTYVFLGGGLGSLLRYLLHIALSENHAGRFPLSTFAINVGGCFLIGLFYALSERGMLSHETRLLLTMGLCGGFTTFSTFSNESLNLLRQGDYLLLLLYTGGSLALGIVATFAGDWAGSRLLH